MDINTLQSRVGRWQAKLRLAELLALLSIAGLSASLVSAQADPAPQPTATASLPSITDATTSDVSEGSAIGDAGRLARELFGVRELFTQAYVVVKSVLVFLVFCSLLTCAILFEKLLSFGAARRRNNQFIRAFRKGDV